MPIHLRSAIPLFEVFDMRASVAFYRDKLGFELVQTWEPDGHLYRAMLKHGGAVVMLNSRYEADEQPPSPDPARAPGHEDAELYFDCADVDAAYVELRGRECTLDPPRVTHYGMKRIMLFDPDGFRLCFQQAVK